METIFEYLRRTRPDWSLLETARVAAYWPHVSPDHGGKVIEERESRAQALLDAHA